MKKSILLVLIVLSMNAIFAQTEIVLPKPNLKRGTSIMTALAKRASSKEFGTKPLNLKDISDVLFAANGINRPEENLRTASSAKNLQEIDVYVFLETGAYKYDYKKHTLVLVAEGDNRGLFPRLAPVIFLLVADTAKQANMTYAGIDTGIVAQNISLACSGFGFLSRIQASMTTDEVIQILNLQETEIPLLNIPVSLSK